MLVIFETLLLTMVVILPGVVGGGLLIAEIIDLRKAKRAKKEGLYVYRYPF